MGAADPLDARAESLRPRPPAFRRWLRGLLIVLGVSVVAVGLAWGLVRWTEGTLREAERAWEAGNFPEAAALADYFLETHPRHGAATVLKARALTRMGRAQEAVALFEQAGAADARDTHVWAEALLTLGRYSEAEALLQRVLALEPDNLDALYEMTACRMRQHAYSEALVTAQQFTEQPGCEARGRLLLATIHHDMHHHEKAIEQCERLLELEPDGEHLQVAPHDFFILYGRTLLEHGKAKESLPILGRSVLLQPTAEAYVLLGEAADQVGEPARAASFYQSALKLDATHLVARENLANQAIGAKDGAAALEWLKPVEQHPQLRAATAYLFQRAHVLLKNEAESARWQERTELLRRRERLTSTLDRFVADSPNTFWAAVIQAYRFAELGNWEQAGVVLGSVDPQGVREEPFVQQLSDAIAQRGTLPPIDQIPIKDY